MRELSTPVFMATDAATDARRYAAQNYGLLGVCPFTLSTPISGGSTEVALDWAETDLAARLLRAPEGLLPRTEESYERRLSSDARRLRHSARRGLTWDGARYCISYEIDLYDGQRLWVEERGQRLSGEGKSPHHIIASLSDISARKRDEQSAVYRAAHDPVTGLWNEARLREALVFLQAAARKFKTPFAFLRLQLSNIADLNTTYGYDVGDRMLAVVAERLQSHFPTPHMIAYVGGANFAVSVLDCQPDEIVGHVQKLMQRLSDVPYPSPHGDLYAEFTVASVDIAHSTLPSIDELFNQTDLALRSALATGQRYSAYNAAQHGKSPAKPRSETTSEDIIAALNDRRISLAYQPIVDAKTRDLHHYESLLRLKRGDGEIVSAGEFIMAAERLGLVHMLDRRALEIASETLRRYPTIELALNVSAATVKNMETAESYLKALRMLGPATARVTIELTETVALDDPAMASRFSVQARMLGCMFSIDDFGSGHTTFQNLMAIEADSIKIDGSFVKELSFTPHKQTFVRMMVDLAQTFSVKTVAEMVETRQDADLLERLGVDYLQGYLFGVPSAAPAWQKG